MTYPFDQIILLAKANGQLMLKCADISRASAQEYAKIGTKAASDVAGQFKSLQPGKLPGFEAEGTSQVLGEIQKVREEALGEVRGAFEEWQGAWTQLLSAEGPKELAGSFQGLFSSLLTKGSATPPASEASAKPAPVKTGARAE